MRMDGREQIKKPKIDQDIVIYNRKDLTKIKHTKKIISNQAFFIANYFYFSHSNSNSRILYYKKQEKIKPYYNKI